MTNFVLVRHGEPDYSSIISKNFKGHGNDLAFLSPSGIEQAKLASCDVRLEKADILISSPYTRALQTASVISQQLNLPIHGEVDLHEWLPDLSFNYDTYELLKTNYMKAIEDFEKGLDVNNEYESLLCVRKRVLIILKKYLMYSKVIVVTHGGVMYSLTGKKYPYCGIEELYYDQEIIDGILGRHK